MIAGIDATYRYRVGLVMGEYDDGSISLHEVREFRTLAGAEGYRDELAARGYVAIVQVGLLLWTSPEDAERRLMAAQSEGARLV